MKRLCVTLLIAALAAGGLAVSLYTADPIYCLWCGSSNFGTM